MRTILRVLMVAVLFGVFYGGLVLKNSNAELVRVSYGAGELPSVELWQALATAFGAGVIVAVVLLSLRLTRSWMTGRRYRKEIKRLEAEVHGLRNLPVVDAGDEEKKPEAPLALPADAAGS